jgi:hypothetical protein
MNQKNRRPSFRSSRRSGTRKFLNQRKHPFRRLEFEKLEVRELLIVGAYAVPGPPNAASWDGVVAIGRIQTLSDHLGTGSLLSSHHHVLTAAHVLESKGITLDLSHVVLFDQLRGKKGAYSGVEIPKENIHVPNQRTPDIKNGHDFAVLEL